MNRDGWKPLSAVAAMHERGSVMTIDRRLLGEQAGVLSPAHMRAVDDGLRLVLSL